MRTKWGRLLILVGIACLSLAASPAPKAKGKAPFHPQVDAGEPCLECHQQVTPKAMESYDQSMHGANTVPCVVCHGALDAGFTAKPPMDRCAGCHGEKVASVKRVFPKGKKACVDCHPTHALTPHQD